jgi:surface protein
MTGMFFGACAFNQPIGKWDVSNVTNKKKMLGLAVNFNQPLSQWNISEEEMLKILDGSFEDDADS